MDPKILGELIPIVAILGAFSTVIAKMFFRFEERKLQHRTQNQTAGGGSLRDELNALHAELARLRDTSTQYDISIQHALEDMQRRLEYLESKRPAATQPASEQPAQQTVNLSGS